MSSYTTKSIEFDMHKKEISCIRFCLVKENNFLLVGDWQGEIIIYHIKMEKYQSSLIEINEIFKLTTNGDPIFYINFCIKSCICFVGTGMGKCYYLSLNELSRIENKNNSSNYYSYSHYNTSNNQQMDLQNINLQLFGEHEIGIVSIHHLEIKTTPSYSSSYYNSSNTYSDAYNWDSLIITTGMDGLIKVWDLSKINPNNINQACILIHNCQCKIVSCDISSFMMVVALSGSIVEIYDLENLKLALNSNVSNNNTNYYSSNSNNTNKIEFTSSNNFFVPLLNDITCVKCLVQDKGFIAVGVKNGYLFEIPLKEYKSLTKDSKTNEILHNSTTLKQIYEIKYNDSKKVDSKTNDIQECRIGQSIAIMRSGETAAIGLSDNNVYLYSIQKSSFLRQFKLKGDKSSIIGTDFSSDDIFFAVANGYDYNLGEISNEDLNSYISQLIIIKINSRFISNDEN